MISNKRVVHISQTPLGYAFHCLKQKRPVLGVHILNPLQEGGKAILNIWIWVEEESIIIQTNLQSTCHVTSNIQKISISKQITSSLIDTRLLQEELDKLQFHIQKIQNPYLIVASSKVHVSSINIMDNCQLHPLRHDYQQGKYIVKETNSG